MTENEVLSPRRPLTGLLVAGEKLRDAVLSGKKTITIREGWRDYRAGDKVLIGCNVLGWATMGKITSVNCTILKDILQKELEADGFVNVDDAIRGLSAYYPDICLESPVTVIRWELIN